MACPCSAQQVPAEAMVAPSTEISWCHASERHRHGSHREPNSAWIATGKVESGVGHAQKTPLKGLRFESPGRCTSLSGPLGRTLGRHTHPRHDQGQVAAVFTQERPALPVAGLALSLLPVWGRTVHLNGCVDVEAAYKACAAGLHLADGSRYSGMTGWCGY